MFEQQEYVNGEYGDIEVMPAFYEVNGVTDKDPVTALKILNKRIGEETENLGDLREKGILKKALDRGMDVLVHPLGSGNSWRFYVAVGAATLAVGGVVGAVAFIRHKKTE